MQPSPQILRRMSSSSDDQGDPSAHEAMPFERSLPKRQGRMRRKRSVEQQLAGRNYLLQGRLQEIMVYEYSAGG